MKTSQYFVSGEVRFSFDGLEINANSREEVLKQLSKMTVEDIIDVCCIDNFDIVDEEVELVGSSINVKAHHIDVEVDEDEIAETGKTEEEIKAEVAKEVFLLVDVYGTDDAREIRNRIKDYLEDEIGYYVNDFSFDVCPEDETIYKEIIGE